MKKVMLLNPAAGHGDAMKLREKEHFGVEIYETTGVGDAERFVLERCRTDPDTQFIVCGGDGTVNEVVNGIMHSGASETAAFSVVPTGSGNDFVKIALQKGQKHRIDLIKYNDGYAVNMINIGFDSRVVEATDKYKKKHKGATAYLMGVADAFFKKLSETFAVRYTDKDGNSVECEGEYVLCAIANGKFCGGGFNFAPLSSVQDGMLDLLMINKVSRAKFLTVFGEFKKGAFVDGNGEVKKKFRSFLTYVKCSSVTLENTTSVCADGEVEHPTSVTAESVAGAINYIA
ncbi:MAG: hypothetical protein IJS94_04600 [Clostridia bacterium]|nr:hypothetical protein [Clostridia bacterium]